MILHTHSELNASFEYGFTKRLARVDPAKTLGLIRRIQSASAAAQTSQPQPILNSHTVVRAG